MFYSAVYRNGSLFAHISVFFKKLDCPSYIWLYPVQARVVIFTLFCFYFQSGIL